MSVDILPPNPPSFESNPTPEKPNTSGLEPTAEQVAVVDVGDMLTKRIKAINYCETDIYDDRQMAIGAATGALTLFPLVATSVANMEAMGKPVGFGLMVTGVGAVASGLAFTHGKHTLAMTKKTPVVDGYAIEIILSKGRKHYPATREADITAVLVPQAREAGDDELQTAARVKRLAETLYDAGASAVLMPQVAAEAAYPDSEFETPAGVRLNTLLETTKPGMPLKAAQTEAGRQLYQVVAGDVIDAQRQTINEVQELPYSPERQAKIERLLTHVAQRLPLAEQESDDAYQPTVPTTVTETQALADRLSSYAQQRLAEQADSDGGWYRMAHDPARHRKEYYTLPVMFGDRYDPAVTRRMTENASGEPVQRISLQDYRPTSEELTALLNKETLAAIDTVPVLAELFSELKQLDAYLQNPQLAQLDKIAEMPPFMSEVTYVRRTLRIAHESDRPQQFRRKMAKLVGGAALAGVVAGGILAMTSADDNPGNVANIGGIGATQGTVRPQWQLEGHNGADTAGYYELGQYDSLDVATGWSRTGSFKDSPTILQAKGYQDFPYVTAAGYWENGSNRTQAGQPLNYWGAITLPVKQGMGLANIRATTPDGQTLPFEAWTSGYDGTVSLKVDTTGRPTGEKERVEYDMTLAKEDGPMTIDMHIPGVKPEDTPALDKPSVADLANDVRNALSYDNTERVQTIVNQATSPEDLRQRTLAAGIANCNLAATVTAIEHETINPVEPLTYTGGYLVKPGEHYIRNLHAWLTDENSQIVDPTPGLKGRSPEDAGEPEPSDAELDTEWNALAAQPSTPPDIPWTGIVGGLTGLGMVGSLARRAQYMVRSVRYGWTDRNRHLSDAQAERVLSHALYGGNTPAPALHDVTERLPATMDALSRKNLSDALQSTQHTVSPLNRKQRRDLRRFTQLRRIER